MAVEFEVFDIGCLKADSDLSAAQFLFMQLDGTDFQFTTCGAGVAPVGILQNKPAAAGRAGQIRRVGISKLVLGGTVVAGNYIKSHSDGTGIVVASDEDNYGAIALEGGTSGKTISVLMEFGEY